MTTRHTLRALIVSLALAWSLSAEAQINRRQRHLPFSLGCGTNGAKLVLHVPAMKGFSDGDPVGTLTDFSGDGKHATASGSVRPTYKAGIQGGQPVVRFDGANNYLTTPSFSMADRTYIITASVRGNSAGSYHNFILQNSGSYYQVYQPNGGATNVYVNAAYSSGLSLSSFAVVSCNAGPTAQIFISGVAGTGHSATGGSTTGAFEIGGFVSSAAGRLNGDIGQVVVYAGIISAHLRQRIQQSSGYIFRSATK